MKKLKLDDLKVNSFITEGKEVDLQTVKGGFGTYDECKSYLASNCMDCNPTWQNTCRFC